MRERRLPSVLGNPLKISLIRQTEESEPGAFIKKQPRIIFETSRHSRNAEIQQEQGNKDTIIAAIDEDQEMHAVFELQEKVNTVREAAVVIGINPEPAVVGYALEMLADATNYTTPILSDFPYNPDIAQLAARKMDVRLQWAEDLQELQKPGMHRLHKNIGRLRNRLSKIDWGTKQGYEKALQIWREGRIKLNDAISRSEPVQFAADFYHMWRPQLHEKMFVIEQSKTA